MEQFWGIEDFMEDFIEQGHQFGGKDERRTYGLRDRAKVANSHSKWEYVKNNPLVVKESEAVGKETKRKLKLDEQGQTAKMQRTITAKRQILEKREEMRSDDRDVNFPAHLLTANENTKLDYKLANE
jgi:hypothetical protein